MYFRTHVNFFVCLTLANYSNGRTIDDFSSLHYTKIKDEVKAYPVKNVENWDSSVIIAWSEQKQPPVTPASRSKDKYSVRERPSATVKWPSRTISP